MTNLSEGLTPFDVANSLVGSGVDSIANVQYIGSDLAGGAFAGGAGIIGFESGVVLTSGLATNVVGPNDAPNKSHAHVLPGDADLNLLIAGLTTHDASVLSFDVTPNGNVLTMRYVFASEEYNEYVGSNFNDVIGLFVNGVNYARLPGSNSAVTINNVNGQTNPEFFVDNFAGTLDTQLDGLTVVLTMTAPVNPGVTNHIKIAIADASDDLLDSAVFLEALSILSTEGNNPPTLDPIGSQSFNLGETLTFTATASDSDDPPNNLTFSLDGAPDGASLDPFSGVFTWTQQPGQTPGDYSFIVRVTDDGSPSFFDEERITVTLIDPNPNQPPSIVLGGSSGAETDAFTQEFTWSVSDDRGLAAVEVAVFQLATGSQILSSTDASGSFNFDAYGPGTFLMLVSAVDSNSLTAVASQTATISDDDTAAPLIVLGGSNGQENDGQAQQFTWNASDASGLASISVTVTQDGNAIFTSTDASGTFNFDAFGLGNFVLTATATDGDSDWTDDNLTASVSSSATISDDDTQGPVIVLGGSSGTESETQTQFFTWDVSDDSGLSVLQIVITHNTGSGPVEIYRTEDTADAVGSFNFDGFGPGDYELAVSAFDADADWIGDVAQSLAARMATVTAGNSPPVLFVPGPFAVNEGQTLTFRVSASDPDLPPDTLTFGLLGGPAGSSLDPVTGVFTWQPDCEAVGEYTVTFTVSDGRGGVDSETVVLRALGITAQARLDGTMARIKNFVTAGILNRGQGLSLVVRLRAARGLLDLEFARPASVLLDSFNAQVNRLVGRGILTSVQAATLETPSIVYWDGDGDGESWNDPLNWSRDRLPEACDDVYIRAEPNATIVHPAGNVVIHSLHSSNALDFQGSLQLATASKLGKPFAFDGTLVMQSGPLDLTGGGDLAGNIILGPGATFDFRAGVFVLNPGTLLGGTGVFRALATAAAGTGVEITVTGDVTARRFLLGPASVLGGTGTFQVAEEFEWTGGTMKDAGPTVIAPGAMLTLNGPADKNLDGRALVIQSRSDAPAQVNWNDGHIVLKNQAVIRNNFGSVFNANCDKSLTGGLAEKFINHGTFVKVGGTGETTVFASFNNETNFIDTLVQAGKVEVQTGTLAFRGEGEQSAPFVVRAGALLEFAPLNLAPLPVTVRTQVWRKGTTFSGDGSVLVQGRVNIPDGQTVSTQASFEFRSFQVGLMELSLIQGGTFQSFKSFVWSGGALRNNKAEFSGEVKIAGDRAKTLNSGTILFNPNTMTTWTGAGDIFVLDTLRPSLIRNLGTFDVQNDARIVNPGLRGQFGSKFVNDVDQILNATGVFKKTGGQGQTVIQVFFENAGQTEQNGPKVSYAGGFQDSGGTFLP